MYIHVHIYSAKYWLHTLYMTYSVVVTELHIHLPIGQGYCFVLPNLASWAASVAHLVKLCPRNPVVTGENSDLAFFFTVWLVCIGPLQ